jgi:hypothetical protein
MSAIKHTFLRRENVIARLKAGEKLVLRCARNKDGIILARTIFFENEQSSSTVHQRTFDHLVKTRLVRRLPAAVPHDELFTYAGR